MLHHSQLHQRRVSAQPIGKALFKFLLALNHLILLSAIKHFSQILKSVQPKSEIFNFLRKKNDSYKNSTLLFYNSYPSKWLKDLKMKTSTNR